MSILFLVFLTANSLLIQSVFATHSKFDTQLVSFNSQIGLIHSNQTTANSSYQSMKDHVMLLQNHLNNEVPNLNENEELIFCIQNFLFNVFVEKFAPAWIGTPWAFNGVSKEPNKGSIACGRFIITILNDLSFNIPMKMARQPSENIIKNLVIAENIGRFASKTSLETIENWLNQKGHGIYIVGLDYHVGFIVNNNGKKSFLHSSYYNPPLAVTSQSLKEKSPFSDSKYKVIGKILDANMIGKWLNKELFQLKYDYFR